MKKYLLLLTPLVLTNCGAIATTLVDAAFDSDDSTYKNDVRSHLRHGDSVRQAERAAHEDQMFRDMGAWN